MDVYRYDTLYIIYFKGNFPGKCYGDCVIGELGRAFGATLQQMVDSDVFLPVYIERNNECNRHLTSDQISELRIRGVHFSWIDFGRTRVL